MRYATRHDIGLRASPEHSSTRHTDSQRVVPAGWGKIPETVLYLLAGLSACGCILALGYVLTVLIFLTGTTNPTPLP